MSDFSFLPLVLLASFLAWLAAELLKVLSLAINFFTLLPNSPLFETTTFCLQPLPQISCHPKKSSKDNVIFPFYLQQFRLLLLTFLTLVRFRLLYLA